MGGEGCPGSGLDRLQEWLALPWEERVRRLYELTRFRLLESRPDWDSWPG